MSDLAPRIVAAIIRDLSDRAGIGNEWDQTDEAGRKEIAEAWIRAADELLCPPKAATTARTLVQDRPLVVFDLEATGVNPAEDRIVEVCLLRREVDGREECFATLVDPERPIPPDATEVNGITDEMVKGKPKFSELVPQLTKILDGPADLAGFNVLSFDIPLLAAELARAGVPKSPKPRRVLDAYRIMKRREPHSLTGAVSFYLGGKAHDEEAHRAEADVRATLEVLDAQVACYEDLPKDVAGLAAWVNEKDPRFVDREGKLRWAGPEAVVAMGKEAGKSLRELAKSDRGYLEWMTSAKASFPPDTVRIVREALAGRFPVRPTPKEEPKAAIPPAAPPGPGPCCEKATRRQCVCQGSWTCPDHGGRCFGTHD